MIACIIMFACEKQNDVTPPTKTQLLTGGSTKAWKLQSSIPEDLCPTNIDNTYFFSADGTFEFDRGTNVESENCSDIINVFGTWSFKNNEATLIVIALGPTGQPASNEPLELINATISSLSEEELVLTDGMDKAVFRKK
ncbi:MAG TPA: lipocalin family protein [Chryseosolibacter sp.]